MDGYVSKDVCEERKERFEQMFDTIIVRLDRIEKNTYKNSNGRIMWKVVGVMLGFSSVTIGFVAILLHYAG